MVITPRSGAHRKGISLINHIKSSINKILSDRNFSEILTGSTWALGGRLIQAFLAMVISVVVARVYGSDVLGIVVMLNSFLLLSTIFTVLGTGTSVLRLIPEHLVKYSFASAFQIYRKVLFLVIAVSIITGFVLFFHADLIAGRFFSKPHLNVYFQLAAAVVVFKSMMLLNVKAIRALKLIRFFAVTQFLPHAINLSGLILLGLFWSTRDIPIYTMLGGYTLTGIICWVVIENTFKNNVKAHDAVHDMTVLSILSISLPMLMTSTMFFVIGETGVLLMGMFRSTNEVGHYAVAVRLANLTSFILSSINAIAAPKFSQLFYSGKIDDLFVVAKQSAKLIFWTTIPLLAIFVLLGKYILSILYGQEFIVVYPALVVLSLGQFFNSISGSTGFFMNMTGHQKQFRNIMFLAAAMNVLLSITMIPSLGVNGAALAGSLSLVAWNGLSLGFIKIKFGKTTGYFPFL